RVILDVELRDTQGVGQAIGPHERREADMAANGRLVVEGQQFAVAPHRARARLDGAPGGRAADRLVVVFDLEGTEVLRAEVQRALGIGPPAEPTPQATHQFARHDGPPSTESRPGRRTDAASFRGGGPIPATYERDKGRGDAWTNAFDQGRD